MSHDDFAFEPVRGLPENLPEGERLLWQGAPDWRGLALHAFHVRAIGIYFALVGLWRLGMTLIDGGGVAAASSALVSVALPAALCIGVLTTIAWMMARGTVYSITDQRVVMRFGLALPMAVNLPFSAIEAVDLCRRRGAAGDLCLRTTKDQRVGYLVMWPHVRPFAFSEAQPMFRAVADVETPARILAEALSDTVEAHEPVPVPRPRRVATRAGGVPRPAAVTG